MIKQCTLRQVLTPLLVFSCLVLFLTACENKATSRNSTRPLLSIAHEQELLTLDPQKRNDSVTWSILGNLFEPLVEFDKNMKIVARLAEKWENPNDLTWRFYLRKNIRFHNGKPFGADDVVYTIERGLRPENPGIKPYLISVKAAKVIDQHTVDIITDRPNPLLLNRLTFVFILPRESHPEVEIQKPVGTGPYRYRDGMARRLLVDANTQYWKSKPDIDRVQFVAYPTEEETVRALLNDQVQLIRDFSEQLIPQVDQCESCDLVTHDGLAVTLLGFNLLGKNQNNPTHLVQVRRAIYEGLNSKELISGLGGRANIAPQLVSPNVFGFDPQYKPSIPDPERGRQLLAEAGFPHGFETDVYGVDDHRLKALARALGAIGVRTNVHLIEWKDLYDRMLNHELPLYTMSWACSTGDASDFFDSCIHSPKPNSGYGNFNIAGYHNPEVDRLIELSEQTLRIAERKALLQKTVRIVMSDLPYIPLYSRYNHYGVSKRISWKPRQDGRLYAFDIEWKQE